MRAWSTGASNGIILEAYTSKDLIKKNKGKKPLGLQWVVIL
jgi:hypothetical protein